MPTSFSIAAIALVLGSLTTTVNGKTISASNALPVVDLGYELHRATFYNSTGKYYNFSNIRYAAPPIGQRRFDAPQPPAVNRSVVQTGTPDRICPQATPSWLSIADQFLSLYLAGQTVFNTSSFNMTAPPIPEDPRTTEDCLFLDVVVPKRIFHDTNRTKGAAVLVWIYGGGYTTGSKTSWGNPAGLIDRSEDDGQEGIIYVSFNYRLGAFGWLSGPTFRAEGGTSNAGFYDQRFALEWVQQYVHLFGGDPQRVTVIGESAGGGSIMHQLTAYGNASSPPFSQAVIQSPAFFPVASSYQQETTTQTYLSLLNITTFAEARQLPFEMLQAANVKQVGMSTYGKYTYGPVVDGSFVPALPSQILLYGQVARDIKVMVSHNTDEGILFTSPFVQNNSAFAQEVEALLPSVRAYPAVLNRITNNLYPPVDNKRESNDYTSQVGRTASFISDLLVDCNVFFLDRLYRNDSYSYYFTVPPAIHGLDIPYTYYNGPSPSVLSIPIAIALQKYVTRFAETGSPNEAGVRYFNASYGWVQDLNITGITKIKDPVSKYRCDWWQKALYT